MTAAILESPAGELVGNARERLGWSVRAWVDKYSADELARLGLEHCTAEQLEGEGVRPEWSGLWDEGNLLLNAGINRMGSLLIAGGGQALDATHCRVGVGDGSTAVVNTDTDLSAIAGSTHRWFQLVDAGFPTFISQTLTAKSTFATGDGNFAWTEWGIDFGTASSNAVTAPLLNRKVPASSMGTKGSGSAWAFTVTIALS
jgi:hypothetical protein